jgi:hypothetical protein
MGNLHRIKRRIDMSQAEMLRDFPQLTKLQDAENGPKLVGPKAAVVSGFADGWTTTDGIYTRDNQVLRSTHR